MLQTSNYFYNSNVDNSNGSGASWNTALGNDGGGNIDTDPLFTNEGSLDFTLQSTSPCIDTGDNSYVVGDEDLAGNPSTVNGGTSLTVDMGCYEYQG